MGRVLEPSVPLDVARVMAQRRAKATGKVIEFIPEGKRHFKLTGTEVTQEDEAAVLNACKQVQYDPGQRAKSIFK